MTGVDVSRDESGEDGSRDNGEDGNRDDRVDGSREAGVSLWLLVSYLETDTRQPLDDSTSLPSSVVSQSESLCPVACHAPKLGGKITPTSLGVT